MDGPGNDEELDAELSKPGHGVSQALDTLGGDIVLLGAGGKIGPTMARMARQALGSTSTRVVAVSRFREAGVREALERDGITTVAADLSDAAAYDALPDAAGVYYLAAQKFGTTGAEASTWWSNASIPTLVTQRYQGVPTVVYSTGNVYPLRSVATGGAREDDPVGPVGEYAQSCLARERIFQHAALTWGTPTTIFRLNYACELRYGVLVDLALTLAAGQPVDVTMPLFNVVWQGDVSAWALRSIGEASSPATILNATGPETVSTRAAATQLAQLMGIEPQFVGTEADSALLSDSSLIHRMYGYPTVALGTLIEWVAKWIGRGGTTSAKPTKFQRRDGAY